MKSQFQIDLEILTCNSQKYAATNSLVGLSQLNYRELIMPNGTAHYMRAVIDFTIVRKVSE